MDALMQDAPLCLQTVLRRAESVFGAKIVSTAASDGLRRASFGEVCGRARRLISALRSLGVKPGDRVATFAWNNQPHVELYLAVPAMGAVLHPLNIRLDPAQVAWIAGHAGDSVVFVDESLRSEWDAVGDVPGLREVVWIGAGHDDDPYEMLLSAHAEASDLEPVDERSAAAICYTSGTTGDPKGVVYTHRSATLHAASLLFADTLGLSERDSCLALVPQFHVAGWGLPWAACLAGADLVLPGRFLDPPSLAGLIADTGVNVSAGVPTVWLAMADAVRDGTVDAAQLKSLRRILCGGAAVSPHLLAAYDDLDIEIVQAWGMTETGVTTASRMRSTRLGEDSLDVRSRQGTPLPLMEVRIVADDGHEAPWDGSTPGELQASGPWATDAYFDPGAPGGRGFQEQFTTDELGRRWLKTGDVATIEPDGVVRIVDRTKDLIKSGGEWISSVELESLLLGHPEVAEVAVVAIPDPRWSERPLACVVPRNADDPPPPGELVDYLAAHVPRWQLPDRVEFVDAIPKTSVGKLDKKKLRHQFSPSE